MNVIVVAMTKDGIIGKEGSLPWRIPNELKHFKNLTLDSTVVMGRTTFMSLRRVNGLPDRKNIVLTSSFIEHGENVILVPSLKDVYHAKDIALKTCYIGGAMLYDSVLKAGIIDQMHISEIKGDYDGDTRFPEYDKTQWKLSHFEDKGEFFYKVLTLNK